MVDIGRREFWLLAVLAAAVLWIGIWPAPIVDVMHVSVADMLRVAARSKL
jgi:NADH-quinone oxidoreductase subunit M